MRFIDRRRRSSSFMCQTLMVLAVLVITMGHAWAGYDFWPPEQPAQAAPAPKETNTEYFMGAGEEYFIVNVSGIDYGASENIIPCFPVIARFKHSNPKVTKIRMQYPPRPEMYVIYEAQHDAHLKLHENFMKKGEYSYSDFVALDDHNRELGRITLTFVPPYDSGNNACKKPTS